MKKILLILFLFSPSYFFVAPQQIAVAAEEYGNATAKYVSVYDGDTVFFDICNWPAIVGKRIGVRVNGIDAPERRDKNEKVKALAAEARMFVVQTLKDSEVVELRNMQRGKYFRIVTDVYVDGQNLGDMLVDKKLAKKYDGKGKRPTWSEADYDNYFGTEEKK